MPTSRETIINALQMLFSALPATALRGEVLPERVPAEGLLILRDGEPGEPEVTLSPLRYHFQHRAEIEAFVQGAARDAAFDTLIASIGAALSAAAGPDRHKREPPRRYHRHPRPRPHRRCRTGRAQERVARTGCLTPSA